MHHEENYQDFLKFGGGERGAIFLGHSLVIIKWTWGFFSENLQDFLHADKHQSFLQVDFNTLGITISYKVIQSLLMGMIKHSQSNKSNKFAISLQYLN